MTEKTNETQNASPHDPTPHARDSAERSAPEDATRRAQADRATVTGESFRRRRFGLLAAAATLVACLYFLGVPENPPGFFVDESSIAYNAHLIARDGADEHGARWPLYFRAFGEYKSPLYIYLLAALYKFTGASIAVARTLSALAGILTALLVGLLAARTTGRRDAGFVAGIAAALTPWLFELSRLVFEVALLPTFVALFLLLVYEASRREEWSWPRAGLLALVLALITYTYSAGRLLAPLYALGLALFITRARWRGVLRAWLVYAATLVPLFLFTIRHPGALGARFADVTFIKPSDTTTNILLGFVRNFLGNFSPVSWLVAGDPEPRHHVAGMGSMLVGVALLGLIGIVLVVARHRREAWWRFALYGLLASAVPSSLTLDHFHTLRLAAVPVFFLAFVAPAVAFLSDGAATARAKRWALAALLFLLVLQGAIFQWQFGRAAPARWHYFDTFYAEVFAAATALPERPIYILDAHAAPGYVHAYWYATLGRMDTTQFVRLPKDAAPPPGALVISTETPCADCRMILHRGSFRAFIAR